MSQKQGKDIVSHTSGSPKMRQGPKGLGGCAGCEFCHDSTEVGIEFAHTTGRSAVTIMDLMGP